MASALKKTPKPQLSSLSTLLSKPTPPPPSSSSLSDPINRIKSSIRSATEPERLADLFMSSFTSPQFHGDRSIYKISIQKLARSNRPDLIERILEAQKSDPTLPRSEGFLIRIVTLYSDARMVDHAVRAFEFIPKAGIKHSERTLCALLTVFLKNKKYDKLVDAFYKVPESIKVSPGITAHNILLQGLCEKGDVDDARKVLDEMPNKGLKLDAVSYNARKVLDEMPNKGLKLDAVSYNAVFNGYLKRGELDKCDEVLKKMSENGLEMDVVTFNCRIAALCGRGRSFEAEELLDVMGAKNVRPNRSTFNTIIEGFCKEGNAKKAMKVFERMKCGMKKGDDNGASPNFDTYIMLIRSLVENGEFDKGLEVFKECVDRKWAPPFGAVRGLVEGLKESRVDEAKDVLAKMRKVVKGDAMVAWKNIVSAISL